MSRLRDLQNKTLSYLTKKVNIEREDIKFISDRNDIFGESAQLVDDDAEKYTETNRLNLNPNRQQTNRLNPYHTFLIDHNLLKPLDLKLDKINIFYTALIIFVVLTFAHNPQFRYFVYGVLFSLIGLSLIIIYCYLRTIPIIQYRRDLLNFYTSELENLREFSAIDDTKYLTASKRRKGWVYITETYEINNFKNSELVLAYAILQNKTLTLYIIDSNFIIKPRMRLDHFNNSLKKMRSCLKLALDLTEFNIELIPHDLTMSRIWNKKCPLKFSSSKDVICQMVIDAPASTFVDFSINNSEVFVVPSYHRTSSLKLGDNLLYLYGVCAREKERWYYKLLNNRVDSGIFEHAQLNKFVGGSAHASFNTYILDIYKKSKWLGNKLNNNINNNNNNNNDVNVSNNNLMAQSMFSLNVIFSRLFWDFWREEIWRQKMLAKIQRSLDRIELAPFLKSLRAEDLNMGDCLPLLFSAEEPEMDDDGGFWVNFPMYYEGNLSVTINIQVHSDIYERYLERQSLNAENDQKNDQKNFGAKNDFKNDAKIENKTELKNDQKYEFNLKSEKNSQINDKNINIDGKNVYSKNIDNKNFSFESKNIDFDSRNIDSKNTDSKISSKTDDTSYKNDVFSVKSDSSIKPEIYGLKNIKNIDATYTYNFNTQSESNVKNYNVKNEEVSKERQKIRCGSSSSHNSLPYDIQSLDFDNVNLAKEIGDMNQEDNEERDDDESEVRILEPVESTSSKFRASFSKMFNDIVDTSKSKAVGYVKKICKSAALKLENSSLVVSLTLLKGTLSVYFPPPPTNRVWMGFRGVPVMILDIKSKIGNRREPAKYPFLTEFLEKKIREEFKAALVIPSTVDLYLPFMSSGLNNPSS